MPLKDLLVSEQDASEEILERILKGYINLAADTRRAMLTPEAYRLSARLKILLVLAARHAWRFVTPGQEASVAATLDEVAAETGIPGNTLRPTITKLKDEHLVDTPSRGVYMLPPTSLRQVEMEIQQVRASSGA